MDLKRLGHELRSRRMALSRTLAEVGDHAGCTRQNVYKVEKALSNPTVNTLERIADGLGMDLDLVLVARDELAGVDRRALILRQVLLALDSGDEAALNELEAALQHLSQPRHASTG